MSILAQEFRKSVAKLKDFRMKVEVETPVGYSTGFLNFDFQNGTVVHTRANNEDIKYYSVGITDGSMIMVIGRSGCGKTTWTIQTAANIVRNYNTSCIFHDDIEGGILENRKVQLTGFDLQTFQDKYISRNTGITAENFYERIKMIHDLKINNRESYIYDTGLYDYKGERIYKLEPTVYILDSLSLLMPDKYTTEDDISGQMSTTATAKMNASVFRRIIPMLKAANIMLFVINHINMKVDINPMQRTKAQVSYLKQGETLPGGNTPVYLANLLLRFDDTKLKETEAFGIAGSIVELSLVKSRSNAAGKSTKLVFNQELGFDADLSLFLFLKEKGHINGAGAYFYIDDHTEIKFSQKKFKEKLYSDPALRQIFTEAVLSELKRSLEDTEKEETQESLFNDVAYDMINQINSVA